VSPFGGIVGPSRIRLIALAGLVVLSTNQVKAAPIDPNNILVSVRHSIREFTPTGALVQIIPLNYGGRDYPGHPPREDPADIVVDQYGWIDCFNGYSNPFLTRYSPVSNTFTHKTSPGWEQDQHGYRRPRDLSEFRFCYGPEYGPGDRERDCAVRCLQQFRGAFCDRN
jgi:hypothetical protein